MAYIFRILAILYYLLEGSLCAELYFLAHKPVKLPHPTEVFLSKADVVQANKYMLGLSAKTPLTWSSEGDIFERPRALAIITVVDGKMLGKLAVSGGYRLSNEIEDFDHEELINNDMFDNEEQQWLMMHNAELSGSQIAVDAQNTLSKIQVKTKAKPLRQEIENLNKVSESINKSEIVDAMNTPTIFIIDVNGLSMGKLSKEEHKLAAEELEEAILRFLTTLRNVYDDRVIVELIAQSKAENEKRQKREISEDDAKRIGNLRKSLNVYQFSSTNYPAIFGLFLCVSVILALAVLFVAVGLWNMDPGKDSIIYRMTTTRMKKD